MPVLTLGATIETARIPELAEALDPLALDDEIPVWIAALNKTRHATLAAVKTALITGGGSSHPPVYSGGVVLYIVPDDVAPGTTTVALSDLAGKDFSLRRGGLPLIPQEDPAIPEAEFEVLDTGGFKLLQSGDELHGGDRFELYVFSLVGAGPSGNTSTTPALFTGAFPITTNLLLTSTHFNKLLQIRTIGLLSPITITLPDIVDVPENQILVFETDINNDFESKITTTGGQYIYFQNQSRNSVYMRFGELLWMYRGEDGWYVINNFSRIYDDMGIPKPVFKLGLNQLLCDGQYVLRSNYQRLWEWVQTLGASLLSDADRNLASVSFGGRTIPFPNRGCFGEGDGSTTFQLPDMMNMALRGLLSDSGSDPLRYLNKPGGYQEDRVNLANEDIKFDARDGSGGTSTGTIINTGFSGQDVSGSWITADHLIRFRSGFTGASETIMKNIGVLWAINC